MDSDRRRFSTGGRGLTTRRWLVAAVVAALAFTGCGEDNDTNAGDTNAGDKSGATQTDDMGGMDMNDTSDESRADKAGRVVEVKMVDGLRFVPAALTVTKGETITFKVTNEDDTFHEFMLGDEEVHAERDQEMMEMSDKPMDMDDQRNSITLEGGETKELTWTFDESGTVIYGCHQPGHYGKGMRGTITVS